MVEFTTEPQPPIPTLEKYELTANKMYNFNKTYGIGIIFIEITTGRKYAKIYVTNQVIDDDLPEIYEDRYQVGMNGNYLKIRNQSPLWNILRKMLIYDGLLSKSNDGAIIITSKELIDYLTNKSFKVKGCNINNYNNIVPIMSGDNQ